MGTSSITASLQSHSSLSSSMGPCGLKYGYERGGHAIGQTWILVGHLFQASVQSLLARVLSLFPLAFAPLAHLGVQNLSVPPSQGPAPPPLHSWKSLISSHSHKGQCCLYSLRIRRLWESTLPTGNFGDHLFLLERCVSWEGNPQIFFRFKNNNQIGIMLIVASSRQAHVCVQLDNDEKAKTPLTYLELNSDLASCKSGLM